MELVHERGIALQDDTGLVYDRARVYGEAQPDGRWMGLIEFVPADGSEPIRTSRETTQRNVNDLAYWATGLEPVYFEGALDRARRTVDPIPTAPPGPAAVDVPPVRSARVEIQSADPTLPLRIIGTRTLTPGQRRRVHDTAVLEYTGTIESPGPSAPGRYGFRIDFRSDNAAALVANFLWSTLHAEQAVVLVEGVPVALTNSALKETLLATAA